MLLQKIVHATTSMQQAKCAPAGLDGIPPPHDIIKISVDGAFCSKNSKGATGVVARDLSGAFHAALQDGTSCC